MTVLVLVRQQKRDIRAGLRGVARFSASFESAGSPEASRALPQRRGSANCDKGAFAATQRSLAVIEGINRCRAAGGGNP